MSYLLLKFKMFRKFEIRRDLSKIIITVVLIELCANEEHNNLMSRIFDFLFNALI